MLTWNCNQNLSSFCNLLHAHCCHQTPGLQFYACADPDEPTSFLKMPGLASRAHLPAVPARKDVFSLHSRILLVLILDAVQLPWRSCGFCALAWPATSGYLAIYRLKVLLQIVHDSLPLISGFMLLHQRAGNCRHLSFWRVIPLSGCLHSLSARQTFGVARKCALPFRAGDA